MSHHAGLTARLAFALTVSLGLAGCSDDAAAVKDGGTMKGKMDGGAMDKGKMDGGAMDKGKMDGAMDKGKMDGAPK